MNGPDRFPTSTQSSRLARALGSPVEHRTAGPSAARSSPGTSNDWPSSTSANPVIIK